MYYVTAPDMQQANQVHIKAEQGLGIHMVLQIHE